LGKKKVISEENLDSMVLPATTDVFGVATKLLGFDRVQVKCADGKTRTCRIRGKMNWRYTRGQAELLRREGLLKLQH